MLEILTFISFIISGIFAVLVYRKKSMIESMYDIVDVKELSDYIKSINSFKFLGKFIFKHIFKKIFLLPIIAKYKQTKSIGYINKFSENDIHIIMDACESS